MNLLKRYKTILFKNEIKCFIEHKNIKISYIRKKLIKQKLCVSLNVFTVNKKESIWSFVDMDRTYRFKVNTDIIDFMGGI